MTSDLESWTMRVSMLYANRTWRPVRDTGGIVHHATPVTEQEARYIFRLADTVRAVIECGECGAAAGSFCKTKGPKSPALRGPRNHSYRVRQARLMFEQFILPKLDRLHQTLCSTSSAGFPVFNPADGHDIDCMSCLVEVVKQQG